MKQYPLLHSKGTRILFALFLTAMLFLSRDTLFSSCILGFAKSQILMFLLVLVLGAVFLWVHRSSFVHILKDRRMVVLAASALILLVPMVMKQDWQLMYFSILFCIVTAVFLSFFSTYREISKYYVVILTLLGVYSIFATYCLRNLTWAGMISPNVFYNSNDWEFLDYIFAYAVNQQFWHRNFGIFREPGVYQFFVLLAVYLNNYCVNWDRLWKLWLCNVALAFTMFTTFAIGGFAEMGLFLFFIYFDKKWYREKWGRILGAAFLLAMLSVIGYIMYRIRQPYFEFTIFYEFYDMFLRLFTRSDSATDRMNAITVNLQFITRNPLVGDTIARVLHGTEHNTSSTLLLYSVGGIACGTMNVAAWVALLWKRERCLIGNLVLLTILFMSFNTQNLIANVFFWLFPVMALVERGLPLIKLPENKE